MATLPSRDFRARTDGGASRFTIQEVKTQVIGIDAAAAKAGISKRTVYQEVAEGRFPRPLQLTSRRIGWLESDVDGWISKRLEERDGAPK